MQLFRAAIFVIICSFVLSVTAWSGRAAERAQNVILFIGDGMGLSTINAASIYGYKKGRALFLQSLPHVAFSETSSADQWVTDSAAGMTAIVTGSKTHNGVLSLSANGTVRGRDDGAPLKTLLEYAEERGLWTGLVTNDEITGATPAALYAHVNDRGKRSEIAAQLLEPRFGDGPEVLVGVGRGGFRGRGDGRDLIAELRTKGYHYAETNEQFLTAPADKGPKVIALFSALYEPEQLALKAVELLSKSPKGYFLMVEWNSHQKDARETLDNTLRLDRTVKLVRDKTERGKTLMIVTADHSYDLRITRARIGEDILLHVDIGGRHTAEEVLIAADGPGAQEVRGFLSNTDIFRIIKTAFGW